jgi:predicted Holliday junction resolvase-like endonuclease
MAILLLIIIALVVVNLYNIKRYRQLEERLFSERENFEDRVEKETKRANTTQRAVIKGQIAEQLFPLSISCAYFPSDMKFMGMPIDYIIFDGYTDTKDGEGEIREVIFADIKTGNASLTKTQRSIKKAIEEGRVRWETIHL